jgi:hypothetical protein
MNKKISWIDIPFFPGPETEHYSLTVSFSFQAAFSRFKSLEKHTKINKIVAII